MGFAKVMGACCLAQQDDLEYVWIDTCCIDESSSIELSESINSRFRWYENAAICYVFLSDFIPGKVRLEACRWWTQGWTLQELLASDTITFYDSTWEVIGTKNSLIKEISDITHIEQTVLSDKSQIFSCSVSQRMSWAAPRKTTRIEDEAYCLLGIFGIHLPLLYGEGRMAFRRLQEEIIRRNADLTIFFWNNPRDGDPQHASLFAESPSAFSLAGPLRPPKFGFPEFYLTNKGVFFSNVTDLALVQILGQDAVAYAFLLGWDHNKVPSAVLLRKVEPGIFYRYGCFQVRGKIDTLGSTNNFYILADPGPTIEESIIKCRQNAFRLPQNEQFQLQCAIPNHFWDATDRVFLFTPKRTTFKYDALYHYPALLAMAFNVQFESVNVRLVVLLQNDAGGMKVFESQQYPEQAELLFGGQNVEHSMPPSDFRKFMPNIASLSNSIEVRLTKHQRACITASLSQGTLRVMSKEISVWDIVFKVETM
ncbi:hypothetical protein GQX73_g7432 [Xylaria multiplex]|uniref:DUF8212 domain-containing protein n=1 Tax=Xylaria multiplex TaxID=323545 RepID=A0A7C8IKS7_9PEZI|nr:hypothetical protein GQX73_g7432 [Xylaria multiplex]